MLCYAMLYYTIISYTMLCCAMLCYTLLDYTLLYYTILYYTILYYTMQYYTIPYYTIPYYTPHPCQVSTWDVSTLSHHRRTVTSGHFASTARLSTSSVYEFISINLENGSRLSGFWSLLEDILRSRQAIVPWLQTLALKHCTKLYIYIYIYMCI